MKCFYRLSLLLILVFASLKGYEDEGYNQYPEFCYEQCLDNSCGFKIFGEYLYWKAVQDSLQYAAVLPGGVQQIINAFIEGEPVTIAEKVSMIEPDFEFQSGFRIGLSYELPCSHFGFGIIWTSLHENIKSSTVAISDIIPITLPASLVFGFINRDPLDFTLASEAISEWDFKYDALDFQIAKSCSFTCCDTIIPFIGVKLARIKQKQFIEYFGFAIEDTPILVQNTKDNEFKGVGPSLGFEAVWEFCKNFNLTGGISGALLIGKFDVHVNPLVGMSPNSIQVDLDQSKHYRVRPTVDFIIGLDWQPSISRNCFADLGIAYEVQYYWNQWQAAPALESSLIVGGFSPEGDLMMHGITVRAGLSF